MFNFLDEIPPLPESASPGLSPLPSEASAPGLGLALDPALIQEPPGAAPTAQPAPAAAPQSTSGLGMADFKSARSQDDKEYLENLPMMQKIGLVLQSYQAGVEGRQNPVEALLANKQKREAEFRHELASTIRTTKDGMEMVRKMPPGKAREAMIEQLVRATGGNGDMVRAALTSVGGEADREFKAALDVLDTPAAQTLLTQASGGDPAKARQLLSDGPFMKRLEQRADQVTLPAVTAKMAVFARTLEKVPGKFKDGDGNVAFTMADLREQNAKLPKQFQLSDAELDAATRNQGSLIAYGLKTDQTLQKEQEAVSKRKDTGTWSDPYEMNGAQVQKNSATGEIRIAVARAPQERQEPALTVTEIVDPNDPKKRIKVDARTGRVIGESTKGADRNIPAPMLKAMAENDGNVRRATMALSLISGKDVEMPGPDGKPIKLQGDTAATGVKGYLPDDLLQRTDPKGVDARAVIADLGSMVIHDRSGAAVTAAEFPRLKPFIPNKTDDPPTVKKKLARFVAEYTAINEELRGMFSEDQGYRQPPSKGDAGGALPLPSDKAQLVAGQKYQTARGVATWNGKEFVQ